MLSKAELAAFLAGYPEATPVRLIVNGTVYEALPRHVLDRKTGQIMIMLVTDHACPRTVLGSLTFSQPQSERVYSTPDCRRPPTVGANSSERS